jgi:hypothetical protein
MSNSPQDSGIPVLTEVIAAPARAIATPEFAPIAPSAEAEAEAQFEAQAAPVEHPPITGWLDEEWTRLEQKISERVLAQLLDRIDTVLEQRIRDSLASSVQQAVQEIRQGLELTLEDVISDAVAQEIDNFQFSKK